MRLVRVHVFLLLVGALAWLVSCGGSSSDQSTLAFRSAEIYQGPGTLTAIWANDGGDKVTRSALRASGDSPKDVRNSVWDGNSINLFGARNEVVSFNLVLEAALSTASGVSVSLQRLEGPGGYAISSAPTSGDGVFNYVGRNIELFFVRYLQINGLSLLSYDTYDERHIPKRFQRPFSGDGYGEGDWNSRPDRNKYYPEIAVPMELVPGFEIPQGRNQSVWVDIYIPREAPGGIYTGILEVATAAGSTHQLEVSLEVLEITLPDLPVSKTMLYLGYEDMNRRYIGDSHPQDEAQASYIRTVRDRHFMMAHRHKISLIDSDSGHSSWTDDSPRPQWVPRLNGSLFTKANGYDGPGTGVGNGVYSIGTYGNWNWKGEGQAAMQSHANAWVNWFDQNAPGTDYFLYLIDESDDFEQINTWARWINQSSGPGSRLKSFATLSLPSAVAHTPELDIAAGLLANGVREQWENASRSLRSESGKDAYLYNGQRPASGSFATDDDGVALRELAWGQFKKGITRWFYWESTYYNNFQGGTGETNVFQRAQTFGGVSGSDAVLGETGWNYTNGDGVLFYPGTDRIFPGDSYGINGPIASLRLKHWRRGIQDVDYLLLASARDANRTASIVNRLIPQVLWEHGVSDPSDPTWVRAAPSWPVDPDAWEAARRELADIILGR